MEVLNDLPPQEIDLTAEEGERVLRHIGEFRSATSRDAKVAALVQLTNLLGWSEVLFLLVEANLRNEGWDETLISATLHRFRLAVATGSAVH